MRTVVKKIMDRLNKNNDEQLLSAVYDLLKDDSRKEPLVLSSVQIKAIKIAKEEVAERKVLTDAEVRKKTQAWLGK